MPVYTRAVVLGGNIKMKHNDKCDGDIKLWVSVSNSGCECCREELIFDYRCNKCAQEYKDIDKKLVHTRSELIEYLQRQLDLL